MVFLKPFKFHYKVKIAKTKPIIIIKNFFKSNLCPSLDSKRIVVEMFKNIPTAMLEVVELQEHSHEADEGDDEEDDD